VALGSCAELETELIISERRRYIIRKELEELQEDIDHESRMLMNLIKSLSQSYERRTTNDERRKNG
jgi:four helix bundle protein